MKNLLNSSLLVASLFSAASSQASPSAPAPRFSSAEQSDNGLQATDRYLDQLEAEDVSYGRFEKRGKSREKRDKTHQEHRKGVPAKRLDYSIKA